MGIGNIGWHTFRHAYSTLLHALGTKPAVQKELLRHADIRTTMNVYTQAVSDEKRKRLPGWFILCTNLYSLESLSLL